MIIQLHEGHSGKIRPGDVVFHWSVDDHFPLHVGIYVGLAEIEVTALSEILVRGLPGTRGTSALGDSLWGSTRGYNISVIGQRGDDIDSAALKQVVLISQQRLIEQSQVFGSANACCVWSLDIKFLSIRGQRTFLEGTCAHFVEWLYEQAGLDIVDQIDTHDPYDPSCIYPSLQIRAFSKDSYPLREPVWSPRFTSYPDCLR